MFGLVRGQGESLLQLACDLRGSNESAMSLRAQRSEPEPGNQARYSRRSTASAAQAVPAAPNARRETREAAPSRSFRQSKPDPSPQPEAARVDSLE